MGTSLSAAVQQYCEASEFRVGHWATMTRFSFWKDYSLMLKLEAIKDPSREELYLDDPEEVYNPRVFELFELPSPQDVYEWDRPPETTIHYRMLKTLAQALKREPGQFRVVFWTD